MQIIVKVTGLDNAQARLTKLGASFHDFTATLTGLGEKMIMFFSQNVFLSQGGALGERWAPLADSTEAQKNKKWPGRGMLVRTGTMQDSFYSDVTPDTLFISNRASYFPFQQLGTGFSRGGTMPFHIGSLARAHSNFGGHGRGRSLPARPMLGINDGVMELIKEAIKTDIDEKIASTNI